MDYLTIVLIAIGLAMDCFAVSVSSGLVSGRFRTGYALKMALAFGLFQGCMPLVSYFLGSRFSDEIVTVDHWIAFGLLCFIGGKMIYESLWDKARDTEPAQSSIIVLAIATSIDAMVTGLIFVPHPEFLIPALLVIGLVSFIFSLSGTAIGVIFGRRFRFNANILGGLILIGIGIRILLEHLLR